MQLRLQNGTVTINILDLERKEVEKTIDVSDKNIKQMYAVNDGSCLLLIDGTIYKLDLSDNSMIRYIDERDIFNFTPTQYGILYAKGPVQDYTVFFNNVEIFTNLEKYYVEGDILHISKEFEDYEIPLGKLFSLNEEEYENMQVLKNYKESINGDVGKKSYDITVYDKTELLLPEKEVDIVPKYELENTLDYAEEISEEEFMQILTNADETISSEGLWEEENGFDANTNDYDDIIVEDPGEESVIIYVLPESGAGKSIKISVSG